MNTVDKLASNFYGAQQNMPSIEKLPDFLENLKVKCLTFIGKFNDDAIDKIHEISIVENFDHLVVSESYFN